MTPMQQVRTLRRVLFQLGEEYDKSNHLAELVNSEFSSDHYIVQRLRVRLTRVLAELGLESLTDEQIFPALRAAWQDEVVHDCIGQTPPTYDAFSFGEYLLTSRGV